MRPTTFDFSVLRQHLRRQKIASLPELKQVLGTATSLTVFRKLKQLHYLSSYTHRGGYYTLPGIARFHDLGPGSHAAVWFSPQCSLVATVDGFCNPSSNCYYADGIACTLHSDPQHPPR